MKFSSGLVPLFLASVASVSAHATFQDFWVGATDKAATCVRLPLSNSPVTDVTSNDLACNVNATPSPGTCTVAAGSQVTVEMHQQPGDRDCTHDAIDPSHHGPTLVYMAKVDSAASAVGYASNWFKIANTGLVSTGVWGTDVMIANCGKVVVTIPADIAPGDYLIRAEVIALHVAGSLGGAQLYMSCFQVTVTGGGSASPATVKFPGAYKATDPGILFDLYGTYTTYTIPGPAVYVPGGVTAPTTTAGATTAKTTTSSTKTTSVTSKTTTSTAATSTSTGLAAQYGQCGGIGWTGPTACVSPYVCTKNGDYYSQCL